MNVEVKTGASSSRGEDVSFESSSLDKLKAGFARTKQEADVAKRKWEEKTSGSKREFQCLSCGKKIKSLLGLKKHWSGKSNNCSEEKGFREIVAEQPCVEDRRIGTEKDREMAEKVVKSQKAASLITKKTLLASNPNGKSITAAMLMNAPLGNLESFLKKAETNEIKKFVSLRFHPNSATRKYLAEKELKSR